MQQKPWSIWCYFSIANKCETTKANKKNSWMCWSNKKRNEYSLAYANHNKSNVIGEVFSFSSLATVTHIQLEFLYIKNTLGWKTTSNATFLPLWFWPLWSCMWMWKTIRAKRIMNWCICVGILWICLHFSWYRANDRWFNENQCALNTGTPTKKWIQFVFTNRIIQFYCQKKNTRRAILNKKNRKNLHWIYIETSENSLIYNVESVSIDHHHIYHTPKRKLLIQFKTNESD